MTKLSTMLENLLTILERDIDRNLCDAAQDVQESVFNETSHPCAGIHCSECVFDNDLKGNKDRDRLLQLIKTVELIDHG